MSCTLIASLDITGSCRAWDMTYVKAEDGVVHHEPFSGNDKFADVLGWVKTHRPHLIAIDAPSGMNLGKTTQEEIRKERKWKQDKYLSMRLCEADLRSHGIEIYSTPSDKTLAQSWIQNGWELYAALCDELGYSRLSVPGPVATPNRPTLVEIYPYAGFVVGLGWKPLPKESLSGQLERASFLLQAATWNGKPLTGEPLPRPDTLSVLSQQLSRATWEEIRETGITLRSFGHDVLDSVVGLVTLIRLLEGHACAVGDPDEGMIVVPGRLNARYSPLERSTPDVNPLA